MAFVIVLNYTSDKTKVDTGYPRRCWRFPSVWHSDHACRRQRSTILPMPPGLEAFARHHGHWAAPAPRAVDSPARLDDLGRPGPAVDPQTADGVARRAQRIDAGTAGGHQHKVDLVLLI